MADLELGMVAHTSLILVLVRHRQEDLLIVGSFRSFRLHNETLSRKQTNEADTVLKCSSVGSS